MALVLFLHIIRARSLRIKSDRGDATNWDKGRKMLTRARDRAGQYEPAPIICFVYKCVDIGEQFSKQACYSGTVDVHRSNYRAAVVHTAGQLLCGAVRDNSIVI